VHIWFDTIKICWLKKPSKYKSHTIFLIYSLKFLIHNTSNIIYGKNYKTIQSKNDIIKIILHIIKAKNLYKKINYSSFILI